jgi:hypothetical protein
MRAIDCLSRSDAGNDHIVMRFSPGGTRLAVATEEDNWVVVLDVRSGSPVHRFAGLGQIYGMTFVRAGERIRSATEGPF